MSRSTRSRSAGTWAGRPPWSSSRLQVCPPWLDLPLSSHERRRFQERFSAAWRQVTRAIEPGIPCVDFSSEVVAVLPLSEDDGGRPGAATVSRSAAAVAGDKGGGRRSFSVGVSRPAATLGDLPDCYGQARRAVEVGRRERGGLDDVLRPARACTG